MYNIKSQYMGEFDVAVCGGGIAGACAAISAARGGAKTILIERGGSLGGTLTEGFMPLILDADNKGGLVKELYTFLDEHNMTIARRGSPIDENGKRIPGRMVDTEGCKYFFDKACVDAGVTVLFHSQVAGVNMQDRDVDGILVVTECGNYSLTAKVYIDATGNGSLADFAGCKWDCGDPHEKRPSPTSMGVCAVGFPKGFVGTNTYGEKEEYSKMLEDNGIFPSGAPVCVKTLPSLNTWDMGLNFQYDVMPDDIESLSRAVLEGRRESFEIIEAHKKIEGYENLFTAFTSTHIGIREGRRIYGEYRITDEDIIEGRRFEDAVCLVTFGVDVHKLKSDDTTDCQRGYKAQPYHIPYRALLPLDCDNMLLAGRCISGDFYPHASYRVMGNMAATGEAAGYAAAECAKKGISPKEYDGTEAREFMISRGYEI